MAIWYADEKIEFDIVIRKLRREREETVDGPTRPVEEEPYIEHERHEFKGKNAMEILRMITEYLRII